MPELAEVETLMRYLKKNILDQEIVSIPKIKRLLKEDLKRLKRAASTRKMKFLILQKKLEVL